MKPLKLAEDVLVQNIDNEAVIVTPTGGMITTVNETGAFLINFLKTHEQSDETSLVNALMKEYDISKDAVVDDVKAFIKEMKNNQIIS
ncbi:coenzyme PQQ synthesis protein D (PqqD) [Kordia sp. SMS9]|uniref:PqqD family protein n=1 Tax=Kordia sp. SMS9 TaxID=2282170 RepID=UPI000E0DA993|nr:PqqD family protein [Kordia sp. SMS9]AXG70713.1 coenzyme PQQ synthesis protein D (PqqD) [Kordia sp. SMS9]